MTRIVSPSLQPRLDRWQRARRRQEDVGPWIRLLLTVGRWLPLGLGRASVAPTTGPQAQAT